MNLTPFLLFDGNCADAMLFYQTCLGGEMTLSEASDTPWIDQSEPEREHKVAHALLWRGAIGLGAADWMHPTRIPIQGNTVCMYINGGKYGELKAIFDKLSERAEKALLDNLRDMPFCTMDISLTSTGSIGFSGGKRS